MNTQGEKINKEGAEETKVDTVRYQAQAGQEQPNKEKVGVVHLSRDKKDPGVMASAAASVTIAFKSAKDAIMGKGKKKDTTPPTETHSN